MTSAAVKWREKRDAITKNELAELNEGSGEREYKPIPVGTELNCRIKEAEAKDARGGGVRIALSLTVEDGEYEGRWVHEGFNVMHSNPETERIALEHLTILSLAVGLEELVENLSDLIGQVVTCEVKKHSEYKGKTYMDIGNWAPCTSLEARPETFGASGFDDDIPF